MNIREIWSKTVGFLGKPANPCVVAGCLLLVIAVWIHQGGGAAVFAAALLLLAIHRTSRELLIPLGVLWVTFHGMHQLLAALKPLACLSPSKASVIVVAILSWSALVGLCLGRFSGKRDDD